MKVVSSSRKRAGVKVNRYDLIKNNMEAPKVYDAGGGAGYTGLTTEVMAEEQLNMYKRTLSSNVLKDENIIQEVRQTKIVTVYQTIIVNVRREDFPSISADIPVKYSNEALQAAWGQFIVDLRVALSVEFVDSIIDRKDMAPVNRILGLRDGGQYFVRQREDSAILEVIQSGNNPEQTSWKVTESINVAKDRLKDSGVAQNKMDVKIDEILQRPTLREQQRETTFRLLEAEESGEIIEAMWDVLNAVDLPPAEYAAAMTLKMKRDAEVKKKEDERTARLAHLVATGGSAKEIMELSKGAEVPAGGGNVNAFDEISTKTFDPEVDIIGLYRLAFECLGRLIIKNPEKEGKIATDSFKFVEDTMNKFREEVDIVVLGSKLLSDLSLSLVQYRERFYNVIMDNIQFYAPANDEFRPARIIRRKMTDLQRKQADEEWATQLDNDKKGIVVLHDKDKLDVEIAEVGGEDEMLFDLEEYIREQEAKKIREAEEAEAAAAERKRLRLLAMMPAEVEEAKDTGPIKKVKKPWCRSKGYVGKPLPVEEEHKSMFDDYDDDLTPKKRVLKGFKKTEGSRPLPVVPGIKFRGLVGPYKKDMAMLQCFATLYKFVCASYGNREKAFNVAMPEEVACIGLVSTGQTRILEYSIWIIDTVYSDGFSKFEDEDMSVAPTMALSYDDDISALAEPKTSPIKSDKKGNEKKVVEAKDSQEGEEKKGSKIEGDERDDKSEKSQEESEFDPLIGMDIDCASTISMPSIDVNGKNDALQEKLEVNMGDMAMAAAGEYENAFKYDPLLDTELKDENITVDMVLDPEDKDRAARYRDKAMRQNAGLVEEIGEALYSVRYLTRPRDPIVLFCAMVSCHSDLQDREREMAKKWCGLWDDASARYKRLMVVGSGLSGLT